MFFFRLSGKFCFLLLIIYAPVLIAQVETGAALDNTLSLEDDGSLISINIYLAEQYDNDLLYQKHKEIHDPKLRRKLVTGTLKSFSAENQHSLLQFLQQHESKGHVDRISPLWIANFINCHASVAVVNLLLAREDIRYIEVDKEYEMLLDTYFQEGVQYDSQKELPDKLDNPSLAWNVTHILADQVWELGFTGKDIVVAILDTGVNYNHEDLQGNMWEHPNYPNHGYNFIENNYNPMDVQSHGTHVAGTVAGNGSSGMITGVAPGAEIMALKVLSDQGGGALAGVLAGIQFAVDYGAQVLNLSLGFSNAGDQTRSIMRTAMDNVRNAGSIATVASGNEGSQGSPPNQVRTPGDVPPPWLHPDQTLTGGTSGVISVGSVDHTSTVAASSSRGPVQWETVNPYNDYPFNPGMGLIRPDVVAPGVDIISLDADNTTGYSQKSGTSMAAPAVAGVVALMLSKNPFLLPEEISQILEESADAISFIKSNASGSGVVNALEASGQVSFGVRYHSHSIDDSQGNNDGNINPGELIYLNLAMENPTEEVIYDLEVRLQQNSPYIEILDSIAHFGTFQPGETITITSAFSFQVADNIPGNHPIRFSLFSQEADNDEIWRSGFNELAFAPNIWIGDLMVDDSHSGNDNGVLEPGEQAFIKIEVRNTGQIASEQIELSLLSQKPYVRVLEPHKTIDHLDPGQGLFVNVLVEAHPSIEKGSYVPYHFIAHSGEYQVEREYLTKLGLIIEDWSSGDFSQFDWELTDSGVNTWSVESSESYQGVYAAQSPSLFSQQTSSFSITLDVTQQDSVSFYRKMDMAASNFAYLDFYVDNTRLARWTASSSWQKHSFSIDPGTRTLRWDYIKALPPIGDFDVWVDKIALPLSPEYIAFAGFDTFTCINGPFETKGYVLGQHSLMWYTSGDGSFDDASQPDTYYLPGENDLSEGMLHLFLNIMDEEDELIVADTMKLYVFPVSQPINLGGDNELCMDEILLLDAGDGFDEYIWSDGSTEQTLLVTSEEFAPEAEIWVLATDENGCTSEDSIIITFNECLDVPDTSAPESLFELYPNPAQYKVTIRADDIIEQLLVFDALGRILEARRNAGNEVKLLLGEYTSGLYIVQVRLQSGFETKKLLVVD